MPRTSAIKSPSFIWQAVLILLPVIVLAAVGLFSLRQDRILAELEAKERAQAIADDLAEQIWKELPAFDPQRQAMLSNFDPETQVSFLVDAQGNLVSPPASPPVLLPQPFDLAELKDAAPLWLGAQQAEFSAKSDEVKIEAFSRLLADNLPERFAAAANFSMGLLLFRQGQHQEAQERFEAILNKYPGALTESGLPLPTLAQIKLLELAVASTNQSVSSHILSHDALCSNAVFHPSLLTSYILNRIDDLGPRDHRNAASWQETWASHELARRLYQAASKQWSRADEMSPFLLDSAEGEKRGDGEVEAIEQPVEMDALNRRFSIRRPKGLTPLTLRRDMDLAPHFFWLTTDEAWLAMLSSFRAPEYWVICRPEKEVRQVIDELARSVTFIPDYFGVGVELAGKNLTPPDRLQVWRELYHGGKTGNLTRELLDPKAAIAKVIATATRGDAGKDYLKVSVHLTSPDTLFARQRTRSFWFGSLIAVSAAAALMGLAATWRAFHRQRQLSDMKSNFVSSVSHELRAPIASVRLMAEGLESGRIREPVKQSEYFRFITQECRRLSSLIENVLDFSRIEQGRKQYEFEPTDVVALVQQTAQLMEPAAAERQVTLAVKLDDSQFSTLNSQPSVDGRALQQALVNLLDNAIKHAPTGSTITVGLDFPLGASEPSRDARINPLTGKPISRITHHASRFLLWVEDQGEGIPPEEHDRIFERFYRRGSELLRETQGVGLGLAIVKHIAEAHGGSVRVRSAAGQGSRFTLELPMEPNEQINRTRKGH